MYYDVCSIYLPTDRDVLTRRELREACAEAGMGAPRENVDGEMWAGDGRVRVLVARRRRAAVAA